MENALQGFKTAHAQGIAATKAEFVKFLRDGELPEETLDRVALFIYAFNRAVHRDDPAPAGRLFNLIIEDGVADDLDLWDNPKWHAARELCPTCDGEGSVPKTAVGAPKLQTKKKTGRVRGI